MFMICSIGLMLTWILNSHLFLIGNQIVELLSDCELGVTWLMPTLIMNICKTLCIWPILSCNLINHPFRKSVVFLGLHNQAIQVLCIFRWLLHIVQFILNVYGFFTLFHICRYGPSALIMTIGSKHSVLVVIANGASSICTFNSCLLGRRWLLRNTLVVLIGLWHYF